MKPRPDAPLGIVTTPQGPGPSLAEYFRVPTHGSQSQDEADEAWLIENCSQWSDHDCGRPAAYRPAECCNAPRGD